MEGSLKLIYRLEPYPGDTVCILLRYIEKKSRQTTTPWPRRFRSSLAEGIHTIHSLSISTGVLDRYWISEIACPFSIWTWDRFGENAICCVKNAISELFVAVRSTTSLYFVSSCHWNPVMIVSSGRLKTSDNISVHWVHRDSWGCWWQACRLDRSVLCAKFRQYATQCTTY